MLYRRLGGDGGVRVDRRGVGDGGRLGGHYQGDAEVPRDEEIV